MVAAPSIAEPRVVLETHVKGIQANDPIIQRGLAVWLFVVNHGIAFDAGLYETRTIVSPWLDLVVRGEDARLPDAGPTFWAFVTTVPLTLLTLASLAAAWHTSGPRGAWSSAVRSPTRHVSGPPRPGGRS